MEKNIHSPVFFTATIRGWKNLLKPEKYKIIILQKLQQLILDNKIHLFAYCIMHNHIHLIWQILRDDKASEIQKDFLENTAKKIKNDLELHHPEVLKLFASSQKDRTYHFWKRRPLSIVLFSPHVFDQKLDYIHNNPVKAGMCLLPEEYKFSSASFYFDQTDSWNILTHCDGAIY
jgi:putative transposase